MIGWQWRALALGIGLASGCATQHEEVPNREAQFDAEAKLAPEPEQPSEAAPEAEATEEQLAPRSLDEIERELALNNAKLRQLGVPLGINTKAEPSGEAGEARKQQTPKKEKDPRRSAGPGPTSKSKGAHDPAPRPEQVKAVPLSPSDANPAQDAAGRCQRICELSAISCDLGDQICELADRHAQEQHYGSACERAISDCDVAKEACDACQ